MSEEKARSDAEALASALGITFYVVRSEDGHFSAVQRPTAKSEIIATIEPPAQDKRRPFDDLPGFGGAPPRD
jgi:hypothetical protein